MTNAAVTLCITVHSCTPKNTCSVTIYGYSHLAINDHVFREFHSNILVAQSENRLIEDRVQKSRS
jgi:hypothetical protein